MSKNNSEAYNSTSSSDVGKKSANYSAGQGSQRSSVKQDRQGNQNSSNIANNNRRINGAPINKTNATLTNNTSNTKVSMGDFVPTRTSSAPPEEHPGETGKIQQTFQPTKTHQGMTVSPDSVQRSSYSAVTQSTENSNHSDNVDLRKDSGAEDVGENTSYSRTGGSQRSFESSNAEGQSSGNNYIRSSGSGNNQYGSKDKPGFKGNDRGEGNRDRNNGGNNPNYRYAQGQGTNAQSPNYTQQSRSRNPPISGGQVQQNGPGQQFNQMQSNLPQQPANPQQQWGQPGYENMAPIYAQNAMYNNAMNGVPQYSNTMMGGNRYVPVQSYGTGMSPYSNQFMMPQPIMAQNNRYGMYVPQVAPPQHGTFVSATPDQGTTNSNNIPNSNINPQPNFPQQVPVAWNNQYPGGPMYIQPNVYMQYSQQQRPMQSIPHPNQTGAGMGMPISQFPTAAYGNVMVHNGMQPPNYNQTRQYPAPNQGSYVIPNVSVPPNVSSSQNPNSFPNSSENNGGNRPDAEHVKKTTDYSQQKAKRSNLKYSTKEGAPVDINAFKDTKKGDTKPKVEDLKYSSTDPATTQDETTTVSVQDAINAEGTVSADANVTEPENVAKTLDSVKLEEDVTDVAVIEPEIEKASVEVTPIATADIVVLDESIIEESRQIVESNNSTDVNSDLVEPDAGVAVSSLNIEESAAKAADPIAKDVELDTMTFVPAPTLTVMNPSVDKIDAAQSNSEVNQSNCIAESPVIKSANLPVTLHLPPDNTSVKPSSQAYIPPTGRTTTNYNKSFVSNSSKASAVPSRPVDNSPTVTNSSKGKKNNFKNKLYNADNSPVDANMMSAYTTTPVEIPPAVVSENVVEVIVKESSPVTEDSSIKLPDNWDDDGTDYVVPVIQKEPQRSLRPMGAKNIGKLNGGPTIKKYSKSEIMGLKPDKQSVVNTLTQYEIIVPVSVDSPSHYPNKGGWAKQQQQPREMKDSRDSNDGNAWKKEASLPPPPPTNNNQRNPHNKKPLPPGPMPKKAVSDPLEKLSLEVIAILNKITPQTFEKLSVQLLNLDVTNTAMLDKVIELIFEKAVQEMNFTHLYADLCSVINENGSKWIVYFTVRTVSNIEHAPPEYFWIKDFTFDTSLLAGPFSSSKDCLNAVTGEVPPVMSSANVDSLEYIETAFYNNALIKIFQTIAGANPREFFCCFVPFDEINSDMRSEMMFIDDDAAKTDAKKKNNFKTRLLNSCQIEFENSVQNDNKYKALEDSRQQVIASKSTLSEQDFNLKLAEIEEERTKIKRRMLGNIRFVGELYKKSLLRDKTVHNCVAELLGNAKEGWKPIYEEQDIELLCRLMSTVGQTLEEKANSSQGLMIESYFSRMKELSQDKKINSRLRFNIEEVIELRKNSWKARRAQEVPLKLEELHKKVLQEEMEMMAKHAPIMANNNNSNNRNAYNQGPPQQMVQQNNRAQGGRGGVNNNNPNNNNYANNNNNNPRNNYNNPNANNNPNLRRDDNRLSRSISQGPGGGYDNNQRYDDQNNNFRKSYSTDVPPNTMNRSDSSHVSMQNNYGVSEPVVYGSETINKAVKAAITEFLGDKEIMGLKEVFAKFKGITSGYLITQLIERCMAESSSTHESLALLREPIVVSSLSDARQEVNRAIENNEWFKMLTDNLLDVKDAPERLGLFLGTLCKTTQLPLQDRIGQWTENHRRYAIGEAIYPKEDINNAYDRFLNKFKQVIEN
eukprot:gene6076-8367_t